MKVKVCNRWRDVCIPEQLVKKKKKRQQMLSLIFFFFFPAVFGLWRYGGPLRTKSQGQICWLWKGNSWEEQTRKWLHFIKDPAGDQRSFSSSPPTLSITALLPPSLRVCPSVCQEYTPSVSRWTTWGGNWQQTNISSQLFPALKFRGNIK